MVSRAQIAGAECLGKQVIECGFEEFQAIADREDLGVQTELVEDLAASAAGCRRRLGWRVDQDCFDPQRAAGADDGLKNRRAFGADRQAERGILDVATGENLALVGQNRRADGELAVGAIGMSGGLNRRCKDADLSLSSAMVEAASRVGTGCTQDQISPWRLPQAARHRFAHRTRRRSRHFAVATGTAGRRERAPRRPGRGERSP